MASNKLFSTFLKKPRLVAEAAASDPSVDGGEEMFIEQLSLREASMPPIGNHWLDMGQKVHAHCVSLRDMALRRLTIRDRVAIATEREQKSLETEGDKRLKTLMHHLNNMGIVRSADQVNFHNNFIKACLPIVYAADWEVKMVQVMEQFGISRIQAEVLIMTPRRWGKVSHSNTITCA